MTSRYRLPLLALMACGIALAEASRAESLHEQLVADARDGRLERFDFLPACLIASGVDDLTEIADAQSHWAQLRQRIDVPSLQRQTPGERLCALHARLHAEVLTGEYRVEASDLRDALESGNYNCLSAVALYWQLAREAGLELEIWSQPGHVCLFSQMTGERIEPASAGWTNVAQGKSAAALAPSARRMTPVQLIGKLYYNRGVLLLQQEAHAEGLALIRTSLVFDPADGEARSNLLAGINNWAVALCREKRFAEARRLIEQGLAIDAEFKPLVANLRYVQRRLGS